ncbi:hypothetical protein EYY60_20310 [Flavobacterium zhairuonense]|uniref:hypothetical protein n=1 Tax=Flavobacterium zhairuonense TaxID=2493631 RepID=UPI0010532823|nr:hypothetical protein [Flavobacterium zhairuonense]KAF2506862.1 hypothetical protein EYY60_20310 [Flavobacterium zhairuonense]
MKTAVTHEETLRLDKIEENTTQILKKINSIRPSFYAKNLKFSKKAEEEKTKLFKELIPKKIFSIEKTLELLKKVSEDPDFSKLEQKDQDFIQALKSIDLENSEYVNEINSFVAQDNDLDVVFSSMTEEMLYFNFLNSELFSIDSKLITIRLHH